MRSVLLIFTATSLLFGATTLDRIVAVVGKHPIKMSDIQRDLRVTEFLNGESADLSVAAEKQSLDRLIDQELIRNDMATAGNSGHLDNEAHALFEQLVKDRFRGSNAQADVELRKRDLTQAELLQQMQYQLVVLRFIDQRFQPGVIISDDDIRSYYDQHKTQLPGSLESQSPKIRETIEAEKVNQAFDEWLTETRKNTRVDYKMEELK